MKIPKNSMLILIDIQKGFDDPIFGNRNNPEQENNAGNLLNLWRKHNLPLIHVRHDSLKDKSPLKYGKIGFEFKDQVLPLSDETVITKHVHSAFIGTDLEEILFIKEIKSIVICGIATDHCVSTTARMSGDYGYHTFVVADCCATFDRRTESGEIINAKNVHEITLASLHNEFAKVINLSDIEF
ncbi:MAG: cysteine hydrolase family protein [Thermoplasmataceae archaeon]